MGAFNSYTVYDKAGNLLANGKSPGEGVGTMPETYFRSLSADVQHRADVMLVLQESGSIARYRVEQPVVPVSTLGSRENLRESRG